MNEILINVISAVVTTVLLPLITWAGAKFIQYLSTKIKDEKASTYLTTATNIVVNAVRSVFQTYVESLKESGTFDNAAQVLALQRAKEITLAQLGDDIKEFITATYGNLDTWLTNQIEGTINLLKNS